MSKMKEMMEFPVIYTFKAMGENSEDFKKDMEEVFQYKCIENISHTASKKGNYISVSVTCEVSDFDELESLYKSIKSLKGLKFHL